MDDMDTDIPCDRLDNTAEGTALGPPPPVISALADAYGGACSELSTWSFLTLARQLVSQGKPSLALQAVLVPMRSAGEQAALETLQRARELYRSRLQANAGVDELASLFAECAIAEARPPMCSSHPLPSVHALAPGLLIPLDSDETSALALTERKQVMLDAFADGSSFVCLQCGDLVSTQRRDNIWRIGVARYCSFMAFYLLNACLQWSPIHSHDS